MLSMAVEPNGGERLHRECRNVFYHPEFQEGAGDLILLRKEVKNRRKLILPRGYEHQTEEGKGSSPWVGWREARS